jgi:hypothetical protein
MDRLGWNTTELLPLRLRNFLGFSLSFYEPHFLTRPVQGIRVRKNIAVAGVHVRTLPSGVPGHKKRPPARCKLELLSRLRKKHFGNPRGFKAQPTTKLKTVELIIEKKLKQRRLSHLSRPVDRNRIGNSAFCAASHHSSSSVILQVVLARWPIRFMIGAGQESVLVNDSSDALRG